MRLLVLNAGSSSLKLSVLDETDALVASRALPGPDGGGLATALQSVIEEVGGIDVVAHRVVHGGSSFKGAVELDGSVLAELAALADLAPLHNGAALEAINTARALLPGPRFFACFDTSFHADMPKEAATYALPAAWTARWSLRRYGFHGLSHAYASRRAAELVGRPLRELRIVSAHIGSGASLAAVRSGRSVDTTMGFTPLEGLVMATRSGSVDPGLVLWLLGDGRVSLSELEDALEQRSGLYGMCGTADLKEVIARADAKDPDAKGAYRAYVHRLRREFGAMAAVLNGIDVLVFTGGAGARSSRLRGDVCAGLSHLGVVLDEEVNRLCAPDAVVSRQGAPAVVTVVEAREDLEIARQVRELLSARA